MSKASPAPRFDRFEGDAVIVARRLLGQRLVRIVHGERLAGTIVEVEAYLGAQDRAAHTFNGRRTERNQSMYLPAGHAYVYFTYGMHYCMNVVCGREGEGTAVLLRAIQPTEGLERMFANREKARREVDLCAGPARLTQALGIDRALDGEDMRTSGRLFVEQLRSRAVGGAKVGASRRVGVDYAGEWARRKLRFYLRESEFVSRRGLR